MFEGRRLIGLNEQLKFLRYHPGHKFVAHYDGAFCRPGTSNKTRLTVMLYLSNREQLVGGATRFLGNDGSDPVSVAAEQGQALVFQHNILHDGEEVVEGVKYTIRTDVEYGPVCWHACVREALGLGGSRPEQARRAVAYSAVVLAPLLLAAWWPFQSLS